jgi:hypothetical protein
MPNKSVSREHIGATITLLSGVQADNGSPAEGTASVGTLTLAANASNGETCTIGGTVYTFVTALDATGDQSYEVKIGAAATNTIDNLIAAINAGSGAGTTYGSGTSANEYVSAAAGAGDTMDVEALEVGTDGDAITTTEAMAQGSWGAGVLGSGADRDGVQVTQAVNGQARLYELTIVCEGTGAQSLDAYLWGLDSPSALVADGGSYCRLGKGANRGHVNDGEAITGTTKATFRDIVEHVGSIGWLYLEVDNLSGTGATVSAYLREITEREV